jgi:23S rRNA pseudouridine955/2504/2580 synthase
LRAVLGDPIPFEDLQNLGIPAATVNSGVAIRLGMNGVQTIAVTDDEADLRLDRWFKRRFPELAHGRLEKLLRTGQIRVEGRRARSNTRLEPGQRVRVPPLGAAETVAASTRRRPEVAERDAHALQNAVLYRDDDVLAINKPAGLAVQGGTGLDRHLDAMLDALQFEAAERPRLVHRLDRDTSGVLLLGRSVRAAAELAEAFRRKDCRKIYWAVVAGVPKRSSGRIELALSKLPGRAGERMAPDEEGKAAVTEYRVLDHAGRQAAWLELQPLTGRTHQLRAHCAAMGTPILGDRKYGGEAASLPGGEIARRLHLHARSIELRRPSGAILRVTAPPPPHLTATLAFLGFAVADSR